MSKLPEEFLKHILDEINYLISTSQDLEESNFSQDQTLREPLCVVSRLSVKQPKISH